MQGNAFATWDTAIHKVRFFGTLCGGKRVDATKGVM